MEFLALLVILFVWGPSLSQEPNARCYLVGQDMAQRWPCLPHETR